MRGGGVITRLEDGEAYKAACNKSNVIWISIMPHGDAQFLGVSTPKEKIWQCSLMGKFCPPCNCIAKLAKQE
jgi:hypothetical protein